MDIKPVSIPDFDHTLVRKNIEMLFEYIEPDGTRCLEWYEGNVISVPKLEGKNQSNVTVHWSEKNLKGGDDETSD